MPSARTALLKKAAAEISREIQRAQRPRVLTLYSVFAISVGSFHLASFLEGLFPLQRGVAGRPHHAGHRHRRGIAAAGDGAVQRQHFAVVRQQHCWCQKVLSQQQAREEEEACAHSLPQLAHECM